MLSACFQYVFVFHSTFQICHSRMIRIGQLIAVENIIEGGASMYSHILHQQRMVLCLKKNQSTPRPSEHPPVMGEKMPKLWCFVSAGRILNLFQQKFSPS